MLINSIQLTLRIGIVFLGFMFCVVGGLLYLCGINTDSETILHPVFLQLDVEKSRIPTEVYQRLEGAAHDAEQSAMQKRDKALALAQETASLVILAGVAIFILGLIVPWNNAKAEKRKDRKPPFNLRCD